MKTISRTGFTMVELLSVMATIAILVSVFFKFANASVETAQTFSEDKMEKIAKDTYNKELISLAAGDIEEKTYAVDNYIVRVSRGECNIKVEVIKDNVKAILDTCNINHYDNKAKIVEV